MTNEGASCIFNPACGYEAEVQVEPAVDKKKVLVIGAGPGGLTASRIAAERGHDVTLLEKSGTVGGQYNLAAVAPHKERLGENMTQMGVLAAKAGVDVKLFTEATRERIQEINPDFVVVATGSDFAAPPVKGTEYGISAWSLLKHDAFVTPQDVAIIGGGLTAMEVMEILAKQGKNVTVIEMADAIARDMEFYVRPYFDQIIKDYNINVMVNTKCVEIGENFVIVERDGRTETLPFGSVVMASGAKSVDGLETIMEELNIDYVKIGDAVKPGKVMTALWSGHEIGRTI